MSKEEKTNEQELQEGIANTVNLSNLCKQPGLGSKAKELLQPENLVGPFKSHEEMMKSLWDEDTKEIKMENKQKLESEVCQLHEQDESGSMVRELTRPENLIGPFSSTDEIFDYLLADDED